MPTIHQNHHVLAVHDVRESAKFYVEVLGFKIVLEPPGWIFVKRDNCMIMLGECPDDMHPTTLGCHTYFAYLRVDDADAYLAEIKARGGQPLSDIASKPWGMREFSMKSTDGHRIVIGHVIPGTPVIPPGRRTMAAMLSVRRGNEAVAFYKSVFGAIETYRVEDPGGAVVVRLSVGDSEFWVADESPEHGNFSPETLSGGTARMVLNVSDPDAVFARALAAGGKEVWPVQESHGWRVGRLVDPFGHHWEVGKELV